MIAMPKSILFYDVVINLFECVGMNLMKFEFPSPNSSHILREVEGNFLK